MPQAMQAMSLTPRLAAEPVRKTVSNPEARQRVEMVVEDIFTGRKLPFWRQPQWQQWRWEYLRVNPKGSRGAWVRPVASSPAAPLPEGDRCWLGLVHDVSLGGIKVQVNHAVESGSLLWIELWGTDLDVGSSMLVRVLCKAPKGNNEWVLACTFVPDAA